MAMVAALLLGSYASSSPGTFELGNTPLWVFARMLVLVPLVATSDVKNT
jgi:hypothetical protein